MAVALAALADAAATLVDVVVHVEEPVGDLVRELDVTEPLAVDATSFSLAQYIPTISSQLRGLSQIFPVINYFEISRIFVVGTRGQISST